MANMLQEMMKPIMGFLNLSNQGQFSFVLDAAAKHLNTGLNLLQGIAAFVSESGHHLSDGGEPRRLQNLFFGSLAFRQIACDLGEASEFAFCVVPGVEDDVGPEYRAVLANAPAF